MRCVCMSRFCTHRNHGSTTLLNQLLTRWYHKKHRGAERKKYWVEQIAKFCVRIPGGGDEKIWKLFVIKIDKMLHAIGYGGVGWLDEFKKIIKMNLPSRWSPNCLKSTLDNLTDDRILLLKLTSIVSIFPLFNFFLLHWISNWV